MYDVPGRADTLSTETRKRWNDTIQSEYDQLKGQHGSRFFSIDRQSLSNPVQVKVKWFADPAEPAFCIDPDIARLLCDWGTRGRQQLHNEYCEYQIIHGQDANGHVRPKRIQVTTELKEYWLCIALHDPAKLQEMVKGIIGRNPSFEDLYGAKDPMKLNIKQRAIAFSRYVDGKINTENVLFMTHPINGLDDLLYIVMFGAKPYAINTANGIQKATREQIFREFHVEFLGCRHADPTAAMGAYEQAYSGKTIAFSDPLGVYILSFTKDIFLFQGESIPDKWIRWSRGQPETAEHQALWQHLELGPSDDEPFFLDDIRIAYGGNEQPLVGGFQLLQNIEVGPLIDIGKDSKVNDDEYIILNTEDSPIPCHQAAICDDIRSLKAEYDRQNQLTRVAPRTMGHRV
jgi:hypothetical protein